MTTNTSWQTPINANKASKAVLTQNNPGVARKMKTSAQQSLGSAKLVVTMPKRYSFDDNGGGYRGL